MRQTLALLLLLCFAAPAKAQLVVTQPNPWQVIVSQPTTGPTTAPTIAPTSAPTVAPTTVPTVVPTIVPTIVPTAVPTVVPTKTAVPTAVPTPSTGFILVPLPNQTVAGTCPITIVAPPAANWANLYIDGVFLTSSPPLTFSWNTLSAANAKHTIMVLYKPSLLTQTINVTVANATGPTATKTPVPSNTPTGLPTAAPTVTASRAPTMQPTGISTTVPAIPPNPLPTVVGEVRPQNTTANNTILTAAQLATFHSGSVGEITDPSYIANVNGQFTGTTDQILTYYALKWFPEFDPNIVRATAVNESNWIQSAHGDLEHVTPTEPNGGSWGILQIAEGVNQGWPFTYPWSHQSTSFNADFKLAYQRACYDGKIDYIVGQPTVGGYPVYTATKPTSPDMVRLYGCIGDWFSGGYYDSSGALNYIAETQTDLANKPWLNSSFLSSAAIISYHVKTLSPVYGFNGNNIVTH